LFEGAWYTDSNLKDIGFKRRFEEKYPDTRFATHMMPYAYDSVNMIVRAFETGQNPAVYLRNLRSYDGTAGLLTKAAASGISRRVRGLDDRKRKAGVTQSVGNPRS
jgi:hypothetical protein